MKISFECDCVLLQETLKIFLKKFISSRRDCDFIISDKKINSQKPVFMIAKHSPHLQVPFTKDTLISALEEFYSAIQLSNIRYSTSSLFDTRQGTNFEKELSNLIDKFKNDLIKLIRENR